MQKINNIELEQSEQLNNNGRIPESNKSIRLLFKSLIGRVFCLKILPILLAGLLLSNCAMKDYNLDPWTTVMNQLVTKPIITAKKNKGE